LTPGNHNRDSQHGAALLIVLLLVATLAFIALSITEKTALAATRAFNERARSESLWRAFGAEALAAAALEAARAAAPEKMSLDDPWMAAPLIVPMEDGAARIFFSDATACFNVNSLVAPPGSGQTASPRREFVLLVRNLGFRESDGERIADVIIDWIDADNSRQPQGAEDDYYTALPSPYRSGGQLLASVSELRAMNGVTREIYTSLKPFLCAHRDTTPSPININMLTAQHAPLLAAILGEMVTVGQAADLIAARPPGGYDNAAGFITSQQAANFGVTVPAEGQFQVISQYVQARAEIIYDTAVLEMTSEYEIDQSGKVRILRRRIGAEE
jgi:general secretion pathway protein K